MSLRVQHEWFEIAVAALAEGQEAALADLGKAVLATVAPADDDAQSGNLTVRSLAHLRLESEDPESYVSEHLTGGDQSFQPDAFAFNLRGAGSEHWNSARIVVARSAVYAGAVFVDYAAEYPNPQFTPALVERAESDYRRRLSLLGLSRA